MRSCTSRWWAVSLGPDHRRIWSRTVVASRTAACRSTGMNCLERLPCALDPTLDEYRQAWSTTEVMGA
jgi:hypothetical protein